MGTLENYTPHRHLTYRPDDGRTVQLPQRGNVRLAEEFAAGGWLADGLPLTLVSYGAVDGLPGPRHGVVLVVSQLVVSALPDRDDLAFPAGLVRDGEGSIVGFRYLARPAAAVEQHAPLREGTA